MEAEYQALDAARRKQPGATSRLLFTDAWPAVFVKEMVHVDNN